MLTLKSNMDFRLWPRVSRRLLCFVFFIFCGTSASLQAEKHSLYFIYTGLSKPVGLPGIYEFTAMGLLDDRQIDYYNSKEKRKIPTQPWMKEKMPENYWEKGTQSRKSKEQWFHFNIKILMDRMRHNDSDLHVLQWRTGCEVEQQGSEVKFSKGIYELSYDGENFLSFDDKEAQWVAPVDAALLTKRKWDNMLKRNQYTKGYLEKECVDWLNKFREYGDEELRNGSPPDVFMFAKMCISDKSKLKLTCLATGFYPKDVMMVIRKNLKSLPKNKMISAGIRPNHDGSYQLRKSVEIKKEEGADYDCLVSHRTLERNIIVELDGVNCDFSPQTQALLIGVVIGVVLMLLIDALVAYILYKNDMLGKSAKSPGSSVIDSLEEVNDGFSKMVKCGVRLDEAQIFKL